MQYREPAYSSSPKWIMGVPLFVGPNIAPTARNPLQYPYHVRFDFGERLPRMSPDESADYDANMPSLTDP